MRCEILAAIIGAGVISGCATVPKSAGFREVSQTVEQRMGLRLHWNQGTSEDALVTERLQALLQQELTAEAAVQVALLNNASLQATFEELGIAQADLVQAGLMKNPVFAGHVRFPDKSGEATNTEFSVSQDFMEIFLRPLRKRQSTAQFEQARLRVGNEVLNLAAEVRSAYYTLQGAEHARKMFAEILRAAQASAELAERQHAAGNINDLELANQQAMHQQVELDLTRSQAEVLFARERLNRLLGIQEGPSWKISDQLPQLPAQEASAQELESLALAQRLDLAAARQEVKALEEALTLVRRGVIPEVNVGVDSERDPDRTRVTGPSFEIPLPLFDQRQAAVARAEAQFRQSQRRLSALETQVRSEVRSAQDRLQIARQLIERYRDTLIPLREKIVAESQKHYNFMLIGVFQLLEAKRDEVNAYREYIEVFRDYWNARAELERAVGGRFPSTEGGAQPAVAPTPLREETLQHHHGGEQ